MALVEQLRHEGVQAEAISVGGMDKRSRLAMTTDAIRTAKVLFPRQGAEELIAQLLGFGVEKHDDLADAFSTLVLKELSNPRPFIGFIVLD